MFFFQKEQIKSGCDRVSIESTTKLLWKAYKHGHSLSSAQLSHIDSDLRKEVASFCPDGVVAVKKLPSGTQKRLCYRNHVKRKKLSAGPVVKDLGFLLFSETKSWPKKKVIKTLSEQGFNAGSFVSQQAVRNTKDTPLISALGRLGKKVCGKYNISEGLRALGFETRSYRKFDDIQENLRSVWPREDVERAFADKDSSLLASLEAFREQNPNLYRSMCYLASAKGKCAAGRTRAITVADQINMLYPEFPNLYNLIAYRVKSVDEKNLGERILDAFFDGANIAPTALAGSDSDAERKLWAEIKRAGIGPLGLRVETPLQTISRLTGLKHRDFSCSNYKQNKKLKEISESATRLMFPVTSIVDPSGKYFQNGFARFFPVPMSEILPERGSQFRIYRPDGSYIIPDLMVSSRRTACAVETKSGSSRRAVEDLLDKYADSDDVDRVVAVLQMNQRIYKAMKPQLSDCGIRTVSGEKFMEYFSKAIDALECSPCHMYVAEAVPRVHSLANIYRFHEKAVFAPHIVLRRSNRKLLKQHNQVLSSLTTCLEKALENTKV